MIPIAEDHPRDYRDYSKFLSDSFSDELNTDNLI